MVESKQHQRTNTSSIQRSVSSLNINHRQIFNTNILESLAISLDWINGSCLKKNFNFNMPININNMPIFEKAAKLLPTLAELLTYLNTVNFSSNTNSCNLTLSIITKYHLTFLEFIYWSLLHFDTLSQTHVNEEYWSCVPVNYYYMIIYKIFRK